MTNTHTPQVIDDVAETDVYIGTLEIRSVGTSKNLFPAIKFSHHFKQEPSTVPYSYRAVIQIAEKIGAVVEERILEDVSTSDNLDDIARQADAALAEQPDGDDDTIH